MIAASTAAIIVSLFSNVAGQRGANLGTSPIPGRFVAIGCVSRAPSPAGSSTTASGTSTTGRGATASPAASGAFILTDYRGDKPTIYRLDGDQSELTFHVGHTLEVAGPLTVSGGTGMGANSAASTLTLKIASMTYISRTCVQIK